MHWWCIAEMRGTTSPSCLVASAENLLALPRNPGGVVHSKSLQIDGFGVGRTTREDVQNVEAPSLDAVLDLTSAVSQYSGCGT